MAIPEKYKGGSQLLDWSFKEIENEKKYFSRKDAFYISWKWKFKKKIDFTTFQEMRSDDVFYFQKYHLKIKD